MYMYCVAVTKMLSLCQIRSKQQNKKELLKTVIELRKQIKQNILLIINDHLDIALAAQANGVHFGQSDFSLKEAKKICPENFIIGISCHNIKQAIYAEKNGASYISIGCMYPSTTKKDTIPVTINTLDTISRTIHKPVCAIGGINHNNIKEVLSTKIDMIAICSYIWNAQDPKYEITRLTNTLKNIQETNIN